MNWKILKLLFLNNHIKFQQTLNSVKNNIVLLPTISDNYYFLDNNNVYNQNIDLNDINKTDILFVSVKN